MLKQILIALTICTLATANLRASEVKSPADSLLIELGNARSASDSLKIYCDILDCGRLSDNIETVRSIINLSRRLNDSEVRLEMLRNLAIVGLTQNKPELIQEARSALESVPESEDKRQTGLYINSCQASANTFATDEDRDNYTRQLLKIVAEMPDNHDPYEKVSRLFSLVAILGGQTQGEMLTKYLDDLDKAINSLPSLPNNYLRARFNSVAAISYWHNDKINKSIRADRNQLLYLNRLEQYYAAKGRKFKNFDALRYVCLRRMVRNHSNLSGKELNDYIAQMNELAARNPDIASDLSSNASVRVGALMRDGNYDQALVLAKELVDSAVTLYDKRFYLRQLIEVANLAGNKEMKRNAEVRNSHLLEEYVNYRTGERVRELQLLYDVNSLRRQQITEKLHDERTQNKILVVAVAVLLGLTLALGMLLFFEYRMNRTNKREAQDATDAHRSIEKKLAKMKEELNEVRRCETEKVQLMTYIHHELSTPLTSIANYSQMILDALPDEDIATANYIKRFIDVIDANQKIIQCVVSDMQEFSLSNSKPIEANKVPTEANSISTIAVDTVEAKLDPGVSIKLQTAPGNPIIPADPRRVQILLMTCIDAMVRSITAGRITVTVEVTDTACRYVVSAAGATPGKEPLTVPDYQTLLNAVDATIAYDPEVPALTLTLNL